MINVTKYNGAFVLEYFTDEQWRLLNERPKTEREEKEHKKLTNERFDAFLQIREILKK